MPTVPEQHETGRRFVQAPVQPVDEDGVVIAILGTLAWVVATAWWGTGSPWFWTGVSGVALGLAGAGFCLWRRQRRRS
ncbi:MAG: DUF2530 domain-containing protein [Propionibacteriaceae bacterium]|nr:DUF2530 domain-containing protein [Propionibacteriaceae bacterium]